MRSHCVLISSVTIAPGLKLRDLFSRVGPPVNKKRGEGRCTGQSRRGLASSGLQLSATTRFGHAASQWTRAWSFPEIILLQNTLLR